MGEGFSPGHGVEIVAVDEGAIDVEEDRLDHRDSEGRRDLPSNVSRIEKKPILAATLAAEGASDGCGPRPRSDFETAGIPALLAAIGFDSERLWSDFRASSRAASISRIAFSSAPRSTT